MRRLHSRIIYYIISCLHDFAFSVIAATYALYLLSHGLSVFEMNLVNAAFMAGNIVFEIPTGVYADYFGRKQSVIMHGFLLAAGALLYALSSSFVFFVVAELLSAISYTFASGALDAWIADSLDENWIDRADFIFSRGQVYGKITSIISGLVGAYLGVINPMYPWFAMSLAGVCISVVAIFGMSETRPVRDSFGWHEGLTGMRNITRESISYGFHHRVIFMLMVSSFISFLLFQPLNMFWAPRFNELSGNQSQLLGWAWAVIAFMLTIGGLITSALVKRGVPYWKLLVAGSFVMSVFIIISSQLTAFLPVLGFFVLYEIGRGIDRPVKLSYLNKYIPGQTRATVLSFDSLLGKIGAMVGLIIFGLMADNTTYSFTWLISGIGLLLLVPVYLQVRNRESAYNTIGEKIPVKS